MRMLHMSIFPILKRCAGGRFWNRPESQEMHSMTLQMGRRALHLWPHQNE